MSATLLNLVAQTDESAPKPGSRKLMGLQGVLRIISEENRDLHGELAISSKRLAEADENIATLKSQLAQEKSKGFLLEGKNEQLRDAFLAQQVEMRRLKDELTALRNAATPAAARPQTPARISQTGQTLYSVKWQAANATANATPEHAVINENICPSGLANK